MSTPSEDSIMSLARSLKDQMGREPSTTRRRISALSLEGLEGDYTEWAETSAVPLGTITALAGRAGIAKSTVLAEKTARWTRGDMEGDLKGQPVGVLIVSGEDDVKRQLVPRLKAAGADMRYVHAIQVHYDSEVDGEETETVLDLSEDLEDIERLMVDTGSRVLIIDPIVSFIDGNPDRVKEVRRALDPIAAMARRLNSAVIVVGHFRKGGSGPAGDMLSGSHAWRDIVRSLIIMAKDNDSGDRIITVDKLNYGQDGSSWRYEVQTVEVPVSGGRTTQVGLAVHMGVSDLSVGDLMDREREQSHKREQQHGLKWGIEKVIEALDRNVKPTELHAIFKEEKPGTINAYLKRLADDFRIHRTTYGFYAPLSHANLFAAADSESGEGGTP